MSSVFSCATLQRQETLVDAACKQLQEDPGVLFSLVSFQIKSELTVEVGRNFCRLILGCTPYL